MKLVAMVVVVILFGLGNGTVFGQTLCVPFDGLLCQFWCLKQILGPLMVFTLLAGVVFVSLL